MIRPTARLRFELDPEVLTDEFVLELKSNYLNISPVHIAPRPDIKDGRIAKNILGLMAVLNYPYWDESDAETEANWRDIMAPWLERKLFKVNATVQNYNETHCRLGKAPFFYNQLEVILGKKVIAIKLPANSAFPAETMALIEQVRALFVAGVLFAEDGFLRVELPFVDPLAAEQERLAAEAAAAADAAAAEGEGEEEGAGTVAPTSAGAPAAPIEAPIDYRIWGVRLQNGTVRRFDSATNEWLD